MTDQPEVSPDQAAPAPKRAGAGQPVIRDRRRVKSSPAGGAASPGKPAPPAADSAGPAAGAGAPTADASPAAEAAPAGAEPAGAEPAGAEPAGAGNGSDTGAPGAPGGPGGPTGTAASGASPTGGTVTASPDKGTAAEPEPEVTEVPAPGGLTAELEAVRAELDERTRDLQRLSAEYANYRKRVERDRALIGEQATASVLNALLPVLDDLDRAREHGELAEGVSAVVDQLIATTRKFGLTPFGDKGDPFDPNRHEAVAHQTSADVSESTCVNILRRGYLLGDRLLRPAMVAVADPE